MPTLQINDLKKQLNQPLFAFAGAGELALNSAIGYLAETQDRLAKVDFDPQSLSGQARSVVNSRVDELTRDAKKAQARFETRVAELEKDARAFPGKVQVQLLAAMTDLVSTYAELASRGEKFVAAIRKDGVKAVSALTDAPKNSTVARREAQKNAEKTPGHKTPPAARKSTARKTSTSRSTAARSTARGTSTGRSTAARSTAGRSTAARSTARKSSTGTAKKA